MENRLIVALDMPDALQALEMAERLTPDVGFFKIGLGMLTSGGLAVLMELKEKGLSTFLDMKLFDIPATVEHATRGLTQIEPDFLTVHGDPHVVSAAVAGRGDSKTKILAVTILTSLDREDLDNALIQPGDIAEITTLRAQRALAAGADGVITSPREAALIAALPEADGKLIVTPGVRLHEANDDQKRTATPRQALAEGATHLVVGRPITQAADPLAAARDILADMARVPNAPLA